MKRTTELVAEPGERVEADTYAGTKIGKLASVRTHWRKDGHRNFYVVEFPDGGSGSYDEESIRKAKG